MRKLSSRTPRGYDGTNRTNRKIDEVLPIVMENVNAHIRNQSAFVLAAWPGLIGQKLSSMTQAVKFVDGVLTVKVNNSTLYSLLNSHDKPKLLQKIKKQFPKVSIRDIVFRIG